MTPEILSSIAGTILSLLFSYVPGLKDLYEKQTPDAKRLVMLVLLLLVAGGIFGLACSPVGADLGIGLACDRSGAIHILTTFIAALVANQATYAISPHSWQVRRAGV